MSKIAPTSFSDVIGLWPRPSDLATAIKRKAGRVRQWRARDSIPSNAFEDVADAARRWGFEQVTMPLLVELYKARWPDEGAEPAAQAAAKVWA